MNEAARNAECKRQKLVHIAGLLQCPLCGSPVASSSVETCCTGGHRFPCNERHFDFLPPELRELAAVSDTENVSAHGYDPIALDIIDNHECVLDAGCGLRSTYYPNVVNMEIVGYDSTDVLGVCERLPFKDASFDAVLSLNTLEHVRDPFQSASEITRVLKPNGKLYCALPFLQPFHGYPNHYYNATSAGLRNLFPNLQIERTEVPLSGLPIFALTWIINWWVRDLPADAAEAFKAKRIGDLLGDPISYFGESWVEQLPAEANERLACVNTIVAKKP